MDKQQIMRKAEELTKAIDNQFSYLLTQREENSNTINNSNNIINNNIDYQNQNQ